MKHFSEGGHEQLWKRVTIRTFNVENRGSFVRTFRARPGNGYSEKNIEKLLEQVAEQIERRFPGHEYELVELGEARFNFVWRGRQQPSPSQEPAGA